MIMFTIIVVSAVIFGFIVTMIGCVSISPVYGVAAAIGVAIGLGAGLWAKRAV